MSIASQLQALESNISDAYDMVAQRGGTMPQRKNMENLDDAIATIPSGGSPVMPMPMVAVTNGRAAYTSSSTYTLPSTITDIGEGVFYNASYHETFIDQSTYTIPVSTFDFSSLITVSGNEAFSNAFTSPYFDASVTSASFDFSSLVTVSGASAFYAAWGDWGSWVEPQSMSVDFSSLTNITGNGAFQNAFYDNAIITSISFPSLSNLGNYTNQFNSMLGNCDGVTVHFPAALQPVIGNWPDVQNGFGGTNTTVLFDL